MKNETARREIESLDYYLQNYVDDYSKESHKAMMMAVDALSSSENPNRWIPCSERLPEENDEVIISARYIEYLSNRGSYVEVGYFAKGSWYTVENDECYDAFLAEVTAWMPLPEPYKADMRGEHENK